MGYVKNYFFVFVSILMFLLSNEDISAQYFGKNKVQYKSFEWYYIQSSHFDIHFYEGGKILADFVAEVAEAALVQIENGWKYNLKGRVPIIVYNSHNDFQQTNVIEEYLEEGVGGVTEAFKNRIILPYEGSYSQFRHVIHHELTHAVMFDMFYGGMFPSSIYTASVFQIPLWIAEGLAEYESTGWNTETDMFNRDATINGYLEYAGGVYNPYWGGNLIFHFIADKYGREKVGEFVQRLRQTSSVDRGLKSAFGMDYEELMEQWALYARRRYWPDIADRKKPEEFSNRLTDHKEMENIYNMSPALSPGGDKIAFISDKSGYFDVYIMSAIDGKILSDVIRGQKNADFEEMHVLAPGMSWSPDGENITLSAKSGKEDALYIVNVDSKSIRQFKFGLDGVFGAEWSPNGDEIAFIGNKDGFSDIYSYSISTKKLRKITDDIFSDKQPSWSPDGKKIAFVSDRKNYTRKEMITDDFRIHEFDYSQWDFYVVNEDGTDMERITNTEYDEDYAVWSPDGKVIAYTALKNGISNIFLIDLQTKESRPITNTLTGCEQLSWSKDGSKLVFVSFSNMGYDIYMIKNPQSIDSKKIQLKNTVYFDELEKDKKETEKPVEDIVAFGSETKPQALNLSKYIFDRSLRDKNASIYPKPEKKEILPVKKEIGDEKNKYQIKKYKLKFSPDIITGSAGYDTFFGIQGTSIIQITDILGNHQILIGTDLYFDLRNSNYLLQYLYLPRRIDYGIGIFQDARYFTGYFLSLPVASMPFRLRNFGIQALASRPFNKFSRLDFSVIYSNLDQTYFDEFGTIPTRGIKSVQLSLSYTKDTSLWGPNYFPIVPLDGTRYNFLIYTSPPLSNKSFSPYWDDPVTNGTLSFTTVKADMRKYFKVGGQYGFAFRLDGGVSFGRDPENFYLGGIDNWLNRRFAGEIRDNLRDIFFSQFITPLRGANYYHLVGSKYFLTNIEFRFPLIQYLLLGWPLPIGFQHIRGSLFLDVGGAWDPYEDFDITTGRWVIGDPYRPDYETHKGFRATKKINGKTYFEDMAASFGIGARGVFLFLLARFDVAWLHNGNKFSSPNYLFSIGFDF